MKRHVMIDIETLGTKPGAVIAAIGAVEFDPCGTNLGRELYHTIDVRTAQDAGMTIDADTALWWMQQPKEAQDEIIHATTSVQRALYDLHGFLAGPCLTDSADNLIVWANGTSFDFPILAEAFRLVGMPQPWLYFNERDCRTLRKVFQNVKLERAGDHHNAIDDARHQARLVQEIMRTLSPELLEAA